MNEQELARKTYQETVEAEPLPDDLKRALRAHERVPAFIDNLAKEFKKLGYVKKETLISCTQDLTRYFIHAIRTSRDQKMMSAVRRLSLEEQIRKRQRTLLEVDALEKKGADYVTSEEGLEKIHTRAEISEKELG